MNPKIIFNQLQNSTTRGNNHFSLAIRVDYFSHQHLGDGYQLRFVINDGSMDFTGRTLEEAFQNYMEFDHDIGRHFDRETEVNGFGISNQDSFFDTLNQACENLVAVKDVKVQMKLAV